MEESGSNLRRAALYGVAGLVTAAIGASTVNVLAAEEDKSKQGAAAQSSSPAKPSGPSTPSATPAPPAPAAQVPQVPPPAPKPVPVPRTVSEPAPVVAAPVAQPVVARPVAQPVVAQPVEQPVRPVVHKVAVMSGQVEKPAPPVEAAAPKSVSVAHAEVKTTGNGKAEVVVHLSVPKPVKKPSPTDAALKKAKAEAGEARKKVERAEDNLSSAKKEYSEKKGEVKKLRKQKVEERKQQRAAKPKPKAPVAPVLTVKTSKDLSKRLQDHGKDKGKDKSKSKGKPGKKLTITVSANGG